MEIALLLFLLVMFYLFVNWMGDIHDYNYTHENRRLYKEFADPDVDKESSIKVVKIEKYIQKLKHLKEKELEFSSISKKVLDQHNTFIGYCNYIEKILTESGRDYPSIVNTIEDAKDSFAENIKAIVNDLEIIFISHLKENKGEIYDQIMDDIDLRQKFNEESILAIQEVLFKVNMFRQPMVKDNGLTELATALHQCEAILRKNK